MTVSILSFDARLDLIEAEDQHFEVKSACYHLKQAAGRLANH